MLMILSKRALRQHIQEAQRCTIIVTIVRLTSKSVDFPWIRSVLWLGFMLFMYPVKFIIYYYYKFPPFRKRARSSYII